MAEFCRIWILLFAFAFCDDTPCTRIFSGRTQLELSPVLYLEIMISNANLRGMKRRILSEATGMMVCRERRGRDEEIGH